MNKRDLYRAIGQIDDDLIEKAASAGKRAAVRPWIKWTGLAACFALVVSAALMLPKLQDTQKTAPSMQTSDLEYAPEMAAPASAAAEADAYGIITEADDMGFDVMTLSVTATEYQGSSVSTDTDFIITANGITEDMVREYVNIIPEVEFTLTTAYDGSVILDPHSLSDNAIVNLELTDNSGNTLKKWAFQTADVFTLTSHYPAGGDAIFTDSGIEFGFSSEMVDITTVSKAFSISPEVDGRFEQRGRTVIFIPEDGLKPGETYTVTLDGTAADLDGVTIGEGVSFSFLVDTDGENLFGYSEGELFTTTADTILVTATPAGYNYTHLPIDVEVFAYASFDAFVSDLSASEKRGFMPEFDSMTAVMEFEAQQIAKGEGVYAETYQIVYPDALPEGVYAVKYSMETEEGITDSSYGFIQVSSLSVYVAAATDRMLVWVNDTLTDDVVSGAEVQISSDERTAEGVTDDTGSVVMDLPESESGRNYVVKISSDGRNYAAICTSGYSFGDSYAEDYYGYIYTSRELYLPTDTIRVWGYILPRRDVELPDKVTVSFGQDDGFLGSVEAYVSSGGSFSCVLDVVDCGLYYLPIEVYINNEIVCNKSIEIGNYDKPIYIMSAETDKEIYFTDEINKVSITAETAFFDGTPAANMTLEYTADWSDEGQLADCDENGKAAFSVIYERGDSNSWNPQRANISISTEQLDSVATFTYLNPILFYHDIMLEAETGADGIDITANYIELGDIDTEAELYAENYPENIRGEAYDCTVTVTGTERYWQAIPAGEYYDFVYKKAVQTYSYELVENSLGPWEVQLKDGKGSLKGLELQEESNYSFTITTTDSDGYTVSTDVWYSGSRYGNMSGEEEKNLHFVSGEASYQTRFSENEDLTIEIYNYEEPFEEAKDGYLISFLQQENFYDVTVREDTTFTLEFDEANLPNANIIGAYYSDDKVCSISKLQLVFERGQRELEVDIITDTDTFAPGGEADVAVRVTDSDGKPVSGAEVLVSVSDEAAFAVKDQSAEFLTSLYNYRSWDYISVYGGMGDMMAEMGGGGPMEYRREFVDDLNFDRMTTDADGKARITISLADNLTSWRITALAAKGKYVGDSRVNITSTLPMFVSPVFSDTFIYGDDVSFGCRTYGTDVDSSDEVFYDVFVENSKGELVDIIAEMCPAGENASFNFGKLEKGCYTLYLSAKCGDLTDAVELPFEVVETAAELWVTKEVTAQEANTLEPTKYPITFSVSNGAYSMYNAALNVVNNSGSVRTDEKAAQNLAGEIMAEFTNDNSWLEDLPSLSSIKAEYGLLSELDAGVGSVYFSARLASAVPELLNRERLIQAFEETLLDETSSTESLTSAYLGLAAYRQPVLNELRSFEQQNRQLIDDYDLLRIGQAYALLGDDDNALRLYNELVVPKLKSLTLSGGKTYLRCDLGGVEEANVEYTALALATASILQLKEADELASYTVYARSSLSHNENSCFYPLCELMTYLSHYRPQAGEKVTISYVKDGKTVTETVSERGMVMLRFNSEEAYKAADIRVVQGDACIVAACMADIKAVSDQKSPYFRVEKTIDSTAKLGEDITVTITVTTDVPGVVYIQDHIPTGFRLADTAAYVDGQTVRFYEDVLGSETITYRIKPVVSGSFVVEMPVAADIDSGTLVTGERSIVEVVK